MIFFGTRGVRSNAGQGHFHCPSCRCQQPYKHKRVRRFFTLYFIPLIPLDSVGEYVECDTCSHTFEPEVLQYDPSAGQAEFEVQFHKAIKRVMVEMMMADGVMDEDETNTVRNVYGQIAGSELSEEGVRAEIALAKRENKGVDEVLTAFAGSLNDSGKEMVIRAAYLVAASDGEFQEEELELISRIATALDMTPAHLDGTLSEMAAEA
jgi:DnaJ-domain-containing protein 1